MLMGENGSKAWDVFRGKAEDKLEMLITLFVLVTELERCLLTTKMLKTSCGYVLPQQGWEGAVDYRR